MCVRPNLALDDEEEQYENDNIDSLVDEDVPPTKECAFLIYQALVRNAW